MYLALFGLDNAILKEIANKWFHYKITSLDTEARRNLQSYDYSERAQSTMRYILNDPTIMSHFSLKEDIMDGVAVYALHLVATGEVLDALEQYVASEMDYGNSRSGSRIKVSQYLQNMVVDSLIDKKNFYTKKFSTSFTIKPPKDNATFMSLPDSWAPSISEDVSFSMVVKFSDFGLPVTVDVPPNSIAFEDFLTSLIEKFKASQSATLRDKNL